MSRLELAKLPQGAIVAFSARCARRVLPLFKPGWPDAPKAHVLEIARIVAFTERFALFGAMTSETVAVVESARDLVKAVEDQSKYYVGYEAAGAVAHAVDEAARTTTYVPDEVRAAFASSATHYAARAMRHVGRPAAAVDAAAIADHELLRDAAQRDRWTDLTPVPMAILGPLWPGGPPEWWPGESDADDA